jgi:hypothetical protein
LEGSGFCEEVLAEEGSSVEFEAFAEGEGGRDALLRSLCIRE